MAERIDRNPIYFTDFIGLMDIDPTERGEQPDGSFEWYDDLLIRPSGIYLATNPFGVGLSREERAALPRHPTGNYAEPIATFPMPLERLRELLDEFGLSDCLDPDVLGSLAADPQPIDGGEAPSNDDAESSKGRVLNATRQRLLEIVEALEQYASDEGLDFDRRQMPGPLGDDHSDGGSFHWLCARIDRRFARAPGTFEKHRRRVCAVRKYAHSTDFYREALPHIAPKFAAPRCEANREKRR